MPARSKSKRSSAKVQVAAFKNLARELGCDESEAVFDKALGKIGKAKTDSPRAKGQKKT